MDTRRLDPVARLHTARYDHAHLCRLLNSSLARTGLPRTPKESLQSTITVKTPTQVLLGVPNPQFPGGSAKKPAQKGKAISDTSSYATPPCATQRSAIAYPYVWHVRTL